MASVETEVTRDKWGNPYIKNPETGKKQLYKRVSRFSTILQETYALERWKLRQTILGLALEPDLFDEAKQYTSEAKSALDRIADRAMDAAGSHDKAEAGTHMHNITELLDAGDPTSVPNEWMGHVHAYETTIESLHLEPKLIEQFVVNDTTRTAGTLDRLMGTRDGDVVSDLKTGKWAARYNHATAIQIAVYANSMLYDPTTGDRELLSPTLRRDVGLLVHLPIEEAPQCTVYALDLEWGWRMAQVTAWVIEQRKKKDVGTVFSGRLPAPSTNLTNNIPF